MRDWLENQNWYWFTLTFQITPFPWHWVAWEWTNYGWGYNWKCGPLGVMIIKPYGTQKDPDKVR